MRRNICKYETYDTKKYRSVMQYSNINTTEICYGYLFLSDHLCNDSAGAKLIGNQEKHNRASSF